MATYRTTNTDFTGGLMSPHLRGRIDIDKFSKGLKQHENFIPSIQGPTRYREGFEWIRQESAGNVRLIDFSINNENRYLLALSAGLINIYSRAGTLLYSRANGVDDGFGNVVNLPYLDDQINDVRWSPEVETMIFTHPLHPPFSLTANSVFEELALYAVSEYVSAAFVEAELNGTFVPNLDVDGNHVLVNDKPRWTLYDMGGTLEYWDIEYNGTKWQVITGADHPSLAVETAHYEVLPLTGTSADDVPTTGWSALLGGTFGTLTEGAAELYDSVSTPLYAGATGSEGLTPWKWEQISFTSHPFQKIDTSDTVLRVSGDAEILRLVSTSSDFTDAVTAQGLAGTLESNQVFTEYKVGNQWGLGRILSTTTTPAAPADPIAGECYIQPVDKVVNVEDPSVRLVALDNTTVTHPPWMERDDVEEGEIHVRADSLIFRTSHIGGWVRVGGNKLFTNVVTGYPSNTAQDGNIRWCRISDYRGVEDHPVDFLYATLDSGEYDSGSVYEVYDWGSSGLSAINVFDGTGSTINDRSAFVASTGGTWRFSMNIEFRTGGDWDTVGSTAIVGAYAGLIVADMSTQRQFDVVECDTIYTEGSATYPKLVSPTGTISSYDLVTDLATTGLALAGNASHTATVTASRIFFDAVRDNGRYLLGALVDEWVLLRVNGDSTSDYSAKVDVLTSIPRDDLTGDLKNEGVFTKFRMGAWYEDNYPNCVSFYEQRRVFAGTRKDPNLVWLSNLNDPTDFRTAEDNGDVLDTTGITYQLGTNSTIIRWLAAGPTLICGTEANEWQLRPNEFSAAITPSNIRITQETSIGSELQGIRTGASVFFPHISGKQLHEFKFDFQTQQFVVSTVTKLVPDLFEEDAIKSMAFQFNPNSVFWIVTENGNLYSLTYRKEDDFYAWAKHSTPNGVFKDVAVLSKGDTVNAEDQLWVIIEREDSGVMTNELERLALQFTDDLSDDFKGNARFLDSHIYTDTSASPTTTVSIPSRVIQGTTASVVVDGVAYTIDGAVSGSNDLPDGVTASQHILVGLPYEGKLQLNPQAFDNGGGKNAYGQIKRVVSIIPYLYKSMGYKIGFDEDNLETIAPKGGTSLYTGFTDEHNIIASQFDVDKTPIIVQDQPYPLTLVSAVVKTDLS